MSASPQISSALPGVDDLARILTLPSRPPINCERDRKRRWDPEAQALVEVMTAKYSRARLTCGCRDRRFTALASDQISVWHAPSPGQTEQSPTVLPRQALFDDLWHTPEIAKRVSDLKAGQVFDTSGLGRFACIRELNPVQAWALREIPIAGGLFGMISVGGGKSILSLLTPLSMPDIKVWALLIKPDQRIHYRAAYLRLREHFQVPSLIFDRGERGEVVSNAQAVHVIPYSLLSDPRSTELLDARDPGGVIADEAHLLANRLSSRTQRFLRFFARKPNRVFCCWSGSTIKRSLKDASHLSAHALGLGSPYPILPRDAEAWAQVVDPSRQPDVTSPLSRALYREFGGGRTLSAAFLAMFSDADPVRRGIRDRIVRTPGVISTTFSSANCSITIRERKIDKIPDSVLKALSDVRTKLVRPDGEELLDAMDIATCARDVGSGFYGYWAYPRGEPPDLIARWFAARKVFGKELRAKLAGGEPHMDSPRLCQNAAERYWREPPYEGPLPVWPASSWPAWAEIKDQVEPDPRTRWIDDFLAKDAAEWAKKPIDGRYGIVWTQSVAFGRRIAELAGISYHGGGSEAEALIRAEDGSRSIVASIPAHGAGRDGLQDRFCRQLIAESPASGDSYEQLLGRLAREGQQADTIETWVYRHTREICEAFQKAVELSEFIEATTPNRQLLLAADCDFL